MWDTHGYQQNWFNPVVNEKYKGASYEMPSLADDEGTIVSFGEETPQFRDLIRATYPGLTLAEIDDLEFQSVQHLSILVSQDMDLFNFLREIVEALHGNLKIVIRFRDLYTKMAAAFYDALQRARKQGLKEASSYWLAWNFAIKPFLSDLRTLLCSYQTTVKRLEWMKLKNHSIVYRTWGKKFKPSFDPHLWLSGEPLFEITRTVPPGSIRGAYVQQVRFSEVEVSYLAHAKCRLDLPDYLLDNVRGVSSLWAAYQGLTNPVGVIWEMIPFSWLIDYFLSARTRLFQSMYDFNPFNSGLRVLEYGHTFHLKTKGAARVFNAAGNIVLSDAGGFEYDLYSRQSGLPQSEFHSYFRLPSDWYHLSIIGAVGTKFLPGPSRRRSAVSQRIPPN